MIRKAAFGIVILLMLIGTVSATDYQFYTNESNFDGYQYNANSANANIYTTMRNYATGASDKTGTLTYIKTESTTNNATSQQFKYVMSAIFSANTASITDSETVQSAEFCAYRSAGSSALGKPSYTIAGWWPATNGTVAAGDYDSRIGTPLYSATNYTWDEMTTGYHCWPLNTAGLNNVSKTSWTHWTVMDTWDLDNAFSGTYANSSITDIRLATGNASSSRPYINITTTAGGSCSHEDSITSLVNSTPTDHTIDWSWGGTTYDKLMVWRNNTALSNLTAATYTNWTGLPNNTAMTISTKTCNDCGVCNASWVNRTATTNTLPEPFTPYYDWFALGNSVTSYSNYYLLYMKNLFDAGKTVSHNTDGAAKEVVWGLNIVNNAPYHNGSRVWVMFGLNDMDNTSSSGLLVANALDGICDAVEYNGSTCHILEQTIMANDTLASNRSDFAMQVDNITIIHNRLMALGRGSNTTWDAIDAIPCNDQIDPVNLTLVADGVHPGTTGHEYMARYIWNKTDYCAVYFPPAPDTSPPASITGLTNLSTSCSAMFFNWTNPLNADYGNLMIWRNNTALTNLSNTTTGVSWTGLPELTDITFSSKTCDLIGNCNATFVNMTHNTGACGVAPTAAFSASDTTVCTVDTVTFTDASINSPLTWNWSFGDGNISALQNPTHIYNITGTYTVNLTVNNTYGADSEVKTNYIVVSACAVPTPAPTVAEDWEACFPWCGIQEIFFWNASSDVSGYKILDHMPEKSAQREVNVTVSAATGSQQLGAWVSPAGSPGVSTIAPGMWRFRTYHNVSSQVGITTLEFHIINRSSTGVETDLFYGNAITKDINTLDPAEQLLSYARRNVTTMFDGDRLVIKVNATTTSVTARTVYMWLGGNTNTSMVQASNFICCEGWGCNTGSEGIAILFGVVGGILGAIAILRRRGEAP